MRSRNPFEGRAANVLIGWQWMDNWMAIWHRQLVEMDAKLDTAFPISTLKITPPLLALIAELDEFKGA